MQRLFADRAAAMSRPVWGFTEIRYGRSDVAGLARLFPGLRVNYVIRDPRNILRSLDEWERQGYWNRDLTEYAMTLWHRVGESFVAGDQDDELSLLRMGYEDLVADTQAGSAGFAPHTGLDARRFDAQVFQRRITGGPTGVQRTVRDWPDLPAVLRALLDTDQTREIAAGYGYRLCRGGPVRRTPRRP